MVKLVVEKIDANLQKNALVNAYSAMITRMPTKTPARGVRTPDFDLTAVREKEPVDGYALKNEPTQLVTPIATSSWLGLIL